MRLEAFLLPHDLFIDRVGESSFHFHHHRLIHLVAHHDTDSLLTTAPVFHHVTLLLSLVRLRLDPLTADRQKTCDILFHPSDAGLVFQLPRSKLIVELEEIIDFETRENDNNMISI